MISFERKVTISLRRVLFLLGTGFTVPCMACFASCILFNPSLFGVSTSVVIMTVIGGLAWIVLSLAILLIALSLGEYFLRNYNPTITLGEKTKPPKAKADYRE